ncbi:hypothetical protein WI367_004304 [Escherichia coli]
MINILKKSPIERLCASVSITPHEMALALAGLNPSMKIGDVPQDKFEQVESARTMIARAIWLHSGKKAGKDEPYRAGDIFLASFPFIEAGTPEAIITAVTDAIDDLRGTKNWEEKALNLGGRRLVSHIKETSRSGRGQYRKLDEEQGNMKMMGLLVLLLVKKSGTTAYIQDGEPNRSAIYRDVEALMKEKGISPKGIAKSTFMQKISAALLAVSQAD